MIKTIVTNRDYFSRLIRKILTVVSHNEYKDNLSPFYQALQIYKILLIVINIQEMSKPTVAFVKTVLLKIQNIIGCFRNLFIDLPDSQQLEAQSQKYDQTQKKSVSPERIGLLRYVLDQKKDIDEESCIIQQVQIYSDIITKWSDILSQEVKDKYKKGYEEANRDKKLRMGYKSLIKYLEMATRQLENKLESESEKGSSQIEQKCEESKGDQSSASDSQIKQGTKKFDEKKQHEVIGQSPEVFKDQVDEKDKEYQKPNIQQKQRMKQLKNSIEEGQLIPQEHVANLSHNKTNALLSKQQTEKSNQLDEHSQDEVEAESSNRPRSDSIRDFSAHTQISTIPHFPPSQMTNQNFTRAQSLYSLNSQFGGQTETTQYTLNQYMFSNAFLRFANPQSQSNIEENGLNIVEGEQSANQKDKPEIQSHSLGDVKAQPEDKEENIILERSQSQRIQSQQNERVISQSNKTKSPEAE